MPIAELAGAQIHYEVRGEGDPLLFVHGTAAAIWGEVPARLAGTHRTIVYDRRGFGRSEGPPAAALSDHVQDAAALLEHLDAAPAGIVGWSMGGVVAIALALERPEVVRSLALIEPALHVKRRPSVPEVLAIGKVMLRRRRNPRAATETFLRWALRRRGGGTTFDDLAPADREAMLANAEAILAEIDLGTGEEIVLERLRGIAVPALLVGGAVSDRAFQKALARARKGLGNPSVRVLPAAAHTPQVEAPGELHDALSAWAG